MANETPTSSAPIAEESPNTENNTEVQEESQEEPATGQQAAKKEEIKYLKNLKLKLDGKEVDEELPFQLQDTPEAREYLTRQLQLSKVGQKRAQEYSVLEKEVTSFLNLLKNNPKEALKNPMIGVDIKKLAAEILEEEISNSQKSPEQLEKEKLEAELKAIKEEREKEKKDADARELERLTDLEFQKYDDMIDKALDKNNDMPKSPYVVKKIAEYMMLGLQNNMDVSVEDVLPVVRSEIQQDIKDMFSAMPDEVVESFLGKDRLSNIRKKNLAKAKTAPQPISKAIQDTSKAPAGKGKEAKKMTYKEFFKLGG